MKKEVMTAILVLALGSTPNLVAANQQGNSGQKPTVATVLDKTLSGFQKEVVSAAEAMPEDKFNFAPSNGDFKGVRTFAQQAKHIAAVNYLLGSGILGQKPPVPLGGPNGPDNITSKADVVKFLNESFEYLHKAIGTLNESNMLDEMPSPFGGNGKMTRLTLATIAIAHPLDHYGQMVEYLRMNNIIPPASRH